MANNEVVFDRSALSVIDMQFLEMKREMGRISEIGTYLINKAKYVVQAVEALAAATGGKIAVPAEITSLINDIYTTSNSIIDNIGTQVSSFAALNETVMQGLSTLTELLNQIFDGDSYNIQVRDDSNSESEGTTFNELLKEYMNRQNEQVNTGTADIDSLLAADHFLDKILNKDEETVEEDEKTASDIVTSELQDKIHNAEIPKESKTDDQFLILINRLNGRSIDSLSYEELYATFTNDELIILNDNYDNRRGKYGLKEWTRNNVTNPHPTSEVNPALFEDSLNTGNDYAPSSFTFEKPDINESDVDWEQYTEDKYDRYRTDVQEDETDS